MTLPLTQKNLIDYQATFGWSYLICYNSHMNTRKIIGIMAEQEVTQAQLAKSIGISLSSLNRKIKTRKFTVGEIIKIGEALGMSEQEMVEIFLNKSDR